LARQKRETSAQTGDEGTRLARFVAPQNANKFMSAPAIVNITWSLNEGQK
jgi:hypothetical protein